ncbi:MAG: hypothetical protein AAGB51_10140 [Planctomycetota bacterium]
MARAAVIAIFLMGLMTRAAAAVISVPGDFPTIQEAIDAASSGDEIVVAPGVYTELVDLSSSSGVTLRSSGGAAVTTIEAPAVANPADPAQGDSTVRLRSGATIEGFTITGGIGATDFSGANSRYGGGVLFVSGGTVRGCVVEGNSAALGGGAFVLNGSVLIEDSEFSGNTAAVEASQLASFNGAVSALRSTFSGSASPIRGAVVVIGRTASFDACVFESNAGGALFADTTVFPTSGVPAPSVSAVGCFFTGNGGDVLAAIDAPAGSGQAELTATRCVIGQNNGTSIGNTFFSGAVTLSHCVVTANITSAFCNGCEIRASVIVENELTNETQVSGGSISNTIFRGNTGVGGAPVQVLGFPLYSNIEGGTTDFGSIDADPMFTSLEGPDGVLGTSDDDPSIDAGSPCIDAADTLDFSPVEVDYFGTVRAINDPLVPNTGTAAFGLHADIGAVEFVPASTLSADVTTTGATLFGQPGFGVPDGVVDLDDLGFYLNLWLLGVP